MKIIVLGNDHEVVHEPTEGEFSSLLQRVTLTNEIRNRDNPSDLRRVVTSEVWPIPPLVNEP